MTRLLPKLITALLLVTVAGCSGKTQESDKNVAAPVAVKGAIVQTVKSGEIADTVDLTGTVKARTSAVVSSRIAGTVKQLLVREGDRVRQGQLLARLDAQETSAAADAAKAGIEEAERALNEAVSNRKLADSNFARYENLYARQVVSRQDFETRQNEKELATQAVARAEARLRQAGETARAAASMSGYANIVSPITGVVSSKSVDLGSTVFPAQVLMTVEDERSYQLELSVPESLVKKVRRGTPVRVSVEALNQTVDTVIIEVVPTADAGSRTYTAKVLLKQAGLRSGMFGHGTVQLDTRSNALLLPLEAIVERGALTSVWVVNSDRRAGMRLVKVGKTVIGKAEILSGLSDGDQVVVGGAEKVSEGVKVE